MSFFLFFFLFFFCLEIGWGKVLTLDQFEKRGWGMVNM